MGLAAPPASSGIHPTPKTGKQNMVDAQDAKYVTAIAPAAIIDDASAVASEIDTSGAAYCEIPIQLGATDIAMTALKVQESDTSGSGFADVTGLDFDGGTAPDGTTLALPSATDDGQVATFQINLLGRKRYLKLVATFGNGSTGGFVASTARLSRLAQVPDVSTDMASGGVCRA